MKKRSVVLLVAGMCLVLLQACGTKRENVVENAGEISSEAASEESNTSEQESSVAETEEAAAPTEINVFIAASLSNVMEEVAKAYQNEHPEVTINFNADSSGTLLTQIEEGAACDIFFSAAQKQMNSIEKEGLLLEFRMTLDVGRGTGNPHLIHYP